MADVKDLEFLSREAVLIKVATRLEKTLNHMQIIQIVSSVATKDNELSKTMPPELLKALDGLPALNDEVLELRSIIHWLTKTP